MEPSVQTHSDRPIGPAAAYSASGILKSYGPVKVLGGVDLELRAGRLHTLMGENGAGKSTLFKILAGNARPDGGRLEIAGRPVHFAGPHDAHGHGIHLVPQEPALMGSLSVAESMFVGRLPHRGRLLRRVDWGSVRRRAKDALASLGLAIDIDQPAARLSVAQSQLVECGKALLHGCRIILFDEPTSPLTGHEVEHLFAIMRRLRADGCALGFISHRMEEVLAISDEVSVLRDGRLVDAVAAPPFDRGRLLSAMVGRPVSTIVRRVREHPLGDEALVVRGLAHRPRFDGIDLSVRTGEIVGLAGLVGAGRTEIAETIAGLRRRDAGTVRLQGAPIHDLAAARIVERGLVYAPEDRARHGAVLPMTIAENLSSGRLDRMERRLGLLDRGAEARRANEIVHAFRIRCAGIGQRVAELSGGNQQKVVFGKWMGLSPAVAILDEPTRGVDVGAKEEIYELIGRLAAQGMAFLVISSETEELVRLCDRVLAVYEGRIVAELEGDAVTRERVSRAYLAEAA